MQINRRRRPGRSPRNRALRKRLIWVSSSIKLKAPKPALLAWYLRSISKSQTSRPCVYMHHAPIKERSPLIQRPSWNWSSPKPSLMAWDVASYAFSKRKQYQLSSKPVGSSCFTWTSRTTRCPRTSSQNAKGPDPKTKQLPRLGALL